MDAQPRLITPQSFGRRLRELVSEPDCSLVWFLGAGCSISSGIPGAAVLVLQWLPRLKRREEGDDTGWEEWAKTRFEGFRPAQAAPLYGAVIDELFPLPRERQQEVERLTSAKEPSVGYALLAVLMAHEEYGERTNVVVTTNFDDLMADSLYLLTTKKPLVVVHESLAPYVRASRSRPLIVKLHGDARLAPRNTPDETADLDEQLRDRIISLLEGSGLVFCGYGGNDHSIARLIRSAPDNAFPLGIYWVGTHLPTGPVGSALKERSGVFHVPQRDFDALMINVADALDLTLPGFDRWHSLFDTYEKTLTKQAKAAEAAEQPEQQKTADRLRTQLDAWKLDADARAVEKSDPNLAEALHLQAIDADPTNAGILGSYALFLQTVRQNPGRADEFYRRAIDAGPTHAHIFVNYAQLLFAQHRNEEAMEYVNQALAQPDVLAAIRLEVAFYLYAHVPDFRQEAQRQLVSLLPAGERSNGWDFSPNLERAMQDGDERLPFLTALADVISGPQPLGTWTASTSGRTPPVASRAKLHLPDCCAASPCQRNSRSPRTGPPQRSGWSRRRQEQAIVVLAGRATRAPDGAGTCGIRQTTTVTLAQLMNWLSSLNQHERILGQSL